MNFNAHTYELFLKLNNSQSEEVKAQFEAEPIAVDIPLNKFRWTPLQLAAYKGNMDLVRYFLDKGANKDYRNSSGFTAQMLAESKGFHEVSGFIDRFMVVEVEVIRCIED